MKTLVDVLDAVKARLEAVSIKVYEGDPDQPNGYYWCSLSVDAGNLFSSGLDGRSNEIVLFFRPMFVGTSQRACLDCAHQGRDTLEGWDIFPDEPAASRVFEEETSPPMLPSTGVAGAFRYTITPTYRLSIDR